MHYAHHERAEHLVEPEAAEAPVEARDRRVVLGMPVGRRRLPVGVAVRVVTVPVGMDVHRRRDRGDPAHDPRHVEKAEQDQHERHRELHGEAEPGRDHHAEDDDRAAHGDDGQGVADAPEHADERGGADPSLPGDDGGDGDHVVGIGRVPHAEEEAEENDRHRGGHAHSPPQVPAPRSPVRESALATIRSPATEMTSALATGR